MAAKQTKISQPSEQLKKLGKLVGIWTLSGDTEGSVTYDWLDGGFFLRQQTDIRLFGHTVKATEIIGHLHPFGEEPSPAIHSRAYDAQGNTLDYEYELDGDTLTIWGGQQGSSAYYKGTFSADGNQCVGRWVYPGGGYTSTMTKVG